MAIENYQSLNPSETPQSLSTEDEDRLHSFAPETQRKSNETNPPEVFSSSYTGTTESLSQPPTAFTFSQSVVTTPYRHTPHAQTLMTPRMATPVIPPGIAPSLPPTATPGGTRVELPASATPTVLVSPEFDQKIEQIAIATGLSKGEVLTRAVLLMEAAVAARIEGDRVGILYPNGSLKTEITGFNI